MALLMDGGSTLTRASMPERLIILWFDNQSFRSAGAASR
jgi:hypothetical protein